MQPSRLQGTLHRRQVGLGQAEVVDAEQVELEFLDDPGSPVPSGPLELAQHGFLEVLRRDPERGSGGCGADGRPHCRSFLFGHGWLGEVGGGGAPFCGGDLDEGELPGRLGDWWWRFGCGAGEDCTGCGDGSIHRQGGPARRRLGGRWGFGRGVVPLGWGRGEGRRWERRAALESERASHCGPLRDPLGVEGLRTFEVGASMMDSEVASGATD